MSKISERINCILPILTSGGMVEEVRVTILEHEDTATKGLSSDHVG